MKRKKTKMEYVSTSLSEKDVEEIYDIMDNVIKWMNDNLHPHTKIIAHCTGFVIMEGITGQKNEKHLKD